MSSTNGLKLLKELDFITNEMQLWKDEENVAYLQSIEAALSEALSPTIWRQREGAEIIATRTSVKNELLKRGLPSVSL